MNRPKALCISVRRHGSKTNELTNKIPVENVCDGVAEYHPLATFHQSLERVLGFAVCLEL